ncbi:uncharacterized protein HMPREF1541_09511 [Cyphellophora europaea CBS 101466]|uniref:thioredoxin-dependent peroxiredoxin n=1 Tax=Cyphellophora europaea (strain CBS 101466) TaxID=1220924 RepID=W2SCB9_CYPE1|nr:uncharacterized protein HMPREF1541_09511 [Cyphellophora europaea CBS 101466]ETN45678.1 hypothetical protein HMPREF1541_09511 [Cyphellophora europaea CBS 101466]
MVELRKRPARDPAPAPPPAKRSSSKSASTSKVKQAVDKAKAAISGSPSEEAKASDHGAGEMPVATETGVLPETTGTAGDQDAAAAPVTNAVATTEATAAGTAGGATAASGTTTSTSTKLSRDAVGSKVNLAGFGGTVTTHEGREVTVQQLLQEVAQSPVGGADGRGKGLVLFTYPKASTPGCTTQACLFRDNYRPITQAGFAIYGLSTDSPKANTNFVAKQGLQYPLLCDPNASLTTAIGMKKPGAGKGTTRGVVILGVDGGVKLWEQAGPQRTLDVVLEYVKQEGA